MRSPGLRYWTTKACSAAAIDICYRVGGCVVSPRQVQGWEGTRILSPLSDWRLVRVSLGLELLRLGFFLCLHALSRLSLYVSSGILPMSPTDVQVFVVSFSNNEQVCLPLPFPSRSTKPWKWGKWGIEVPDLLPMVPIRWLDIACLHGLSLPRCRLGMLLPLLCTCHPSFCHCKNYYVVPLLFWVLVFCRAKDWT
jgi:hypothetical protein